MVIGAYIFSGIVILYVLVVLAYMHPWNAQNRLEEELPEPEDQQDVGELVSNMIADSWRN